VYQQKQVKHNVEHTGGTRCDIAGRERESGKVMLAVEQRDGESGCERRSERERECWAGPAIQWEEEEGAVQPALKKKKMEEEEEGAALIAEGKKERSNEVRVLFSCVFWLFSANSK
jgi:hypothetical protein